MEKKIFATCFAIILCFIVPMAGCSGDVTASGSKITSSAVFSSTASSSAAFSAEKQEYIDLLTPVLKELGETSKIEDLVLDDPIDIKDLDSKKIQKIHFVVGNRALQAAVDVDLENDEKKLSSISSEDDLLHYYYYPNALAVNQLGASFKIHLYDYETDEEIDITGEASATQTVAEQSVSDIIQSLDDITINQEQTKDLTLALNINIDSSRGESNEDIATIYYYNIMQFISEYLEIESAPYQLIAFYALIDDNYAGFLMFSYAPEAGFVGTSRPIILNSDVKDAFEKKYDEYMLDIDADTLKAKSDS